MKQRSSWCRRLRRCWLVACMLPAVPSWAVEEFDQLNSAAPAVEAKAFASPGITGVLGYFSPSRDGYLIKLYPKLPETLPLWFGDYSWDRLDDLPIADLHVPKGSSAINEYQQALERLNQAIDPKDPLREEKLFLRGDVRMVLWRAGRPNLLSDALSAYDDAMHAYPESRLLRNARYAQGLILLERADHIAVSIVGNREAQRYKDSPREAMYFRGLVMENYYRASRYVRGESFMWELAREIQREDLTEHLALRYGDSLFWAGRYEEVVEWYTKMQVFLEHATTPVTQLSQLYYAESLFQVGKTALAELAFSQFERKYSSDYPRRLVEYRRLQCQLAENLVTPAVALQQLANMIKTADTILMAAATEMGWSRLAILSNEPTQHEEALLRMSALADRLQVRSDEVPTVVIREALLVEAYANWRRQHYATALKAARMVAAYHYLADERVRTAAANIVALLLVDIAPLYFARDNQVGFLVLAHRVRDAIEEANYQSYVLPWVARAYLESGMTGAGARLYQRIFFDLSLNSVQQDLILLEMARSYGMMQKSDLLTKTLAMIGRMPEDPRARHLYLLTHAVDDYFGKRYDDCAGRYEQLMKDGVRGDELYGFAIAGAHCAMLAKKYDAAIKFIGIVIPEHDKLPEGLGGSSTTRKWQADAIFEKIEILAAKGDHQAAVDLFGQVRAWADAPTPPLTTVFAVVGAYRGLQLSDKAAEVWSQFGNADQDVPPDVSTQYGKLLELLSQKELLPAPATN